MIVIAAGIYFFVKQHPSYLLTKTEKTTSLTETPIPPEFAGIPIYPGAVFLGKKIEKVCPSQIPESCQPAITYTFQVTNTDKEPLAKDTDIDKDKIVNWYLNDESSQGWKVGGGGGCPAPGICFAGIYKKGDPRSFQMDVYYDEDQDKPLSKIDIRFAKYTTATEGWKTYTNTKYEFSLKYPSDFSLIEYSAEPTQDQVTTILMLEGKGNGDHSIINFGVAKTNLTLTDWIKSKGICQVCEEFGDFTFLKGPITDSIEFNILDKQWPSRETIFKTSGVLFEISLVNYIPNNPLSDANVLIYNTILSTFKFLDQTSDSGGCKITGCSGEICSDKDLVSPCVIKAEYECYRSAKCERQISDMWLNTKCGWTQTEELDKCLGKFQSR